MRNLSYREASISLLLIAVSALGAYQLWFVPALAQTERDRQTIERLLVTLAQPLPARVAAASQPASPVISPAVAPLSAPPQVARHRSVRTKHERTPHLAKQPFELACADDSKDPLCGALDR